MINNSHIRLLKGSLIVFVFLLAIGVSGQLGKADDTGLDPDADSPKEVSLEQVFSEESEEDRRSFLPPDFENEVVDLKDFSEVCISSDASVIGFLSPKDVKSTQAFCTDSLTTKGWTEIESGQEGIASYIRADERYSWILLSCTVVGEDTAVVLRVR